MELNKHTITTVYEHLRDANVATFEAGQALAVVETAYERTRLEGIATGVIKGKNEDLREASALEVLGEERLLLDEAQRTYDHMKHLLNLERLIESELKMQMRLAELTNGPKER